MTGSAPLLGRPGLAVLESPDGRSFATLSNAWSLGAAPAALAYEATLRGTRLVSAPSDLSGVATPVLLDGRGPGDARALRVGARGWARGVTAGRDGDASFACVTSSGFVLPGRTPVRHRRALCLFPDGCLAGMDEWTGRGTTRVELGFPLAPGLSAEARGDGAHVRAPDGAAWTLVVPGFAVVVRERSDRGLSALVAAATLGLPARALHAWTPGTDLPFVSAHPVAAAEVRVEVRRGGTTLSCHVPRWEAP